MNNLPCVARTSTRAFTGLSLVALVALLPLLGSLTGCSSGEAGTDDTAWVGTPEYDLSRTFSVAPGGRLVIDADRGAIEVSTGSDESVQVEVFRKVTRGSEKRARQLINAHQVTFDQDGSLVSVRARLDNGISSWRSWRSGLQVRYVVTVPRAFDLDLKTAGGSIKVPDQTGTVTATTSGGSLKLGAIDGSVTVRTSGGGIAVRSATQAIHARTSGGTIELGVAFAEAKLSTSGGSIRVEEARGPLDAGTSGGSITIKQAFAAVEATTSGGSIRAGLAPSYDAECRLSTSGGNVSLSVPEGIDATLDAHTSGGRVTSELPVTVRGDLKRTAIVGTLGAGGKLIKLRTSGGSIHVTKG